VKFQQKYVHLVGKPQKENPVFHSQPVVADIRYAQTQDSPHLCQGSGSNSENTHKNNFGYLPQKPDGPQIVQPPSTSKRDASRNRTSHPHQWQYVGLYL
jgi:hypothetical protein